LQAGGHRFDPDRLHQVCLTRALLRDMIALRQLAISPEMKTPVPLVGLRAGQAVIAGFARFFDIVNGFFNRCRDASYWPGPARVLGGTMVRYYKMCKHLAEIISSALMLQVSSMDWDWLPSCKR
jgi:hypothetical protein